MARTAIFAIVALGFLVSNSALRADSDGSRPDAARSWGERVEAREAALTGEAVVMRQVADSLAAGGFVGPLSVEGGVGGGASFQAVARRTGDTIDIDLAGTSGGEVHPRRHRYAVDGRSEPSVHRPGFLTNKNLNLDKEITVTTGIPGVDADLHANGNFTVSGGPISVAGAARPVGVFSNRTRDTSESMFRPSSGAPVQPGIHITMPTFSAASFAATAAEVYPVGFTLPPILALGTRENPKIIYVDGNVRMVGPTTVTGYGAIVATGTILVDHSLTTVRPEGAPAESSLALFTETNVSVTRADLQLHAQVYTGSNFTAERNTHVVGSVATLNNATFSGALSLEYLPRSPFLDRLIWPRVGTSGSSGTGIGGRAGTLRVLAVVEGVADV